MIRIQWLPILALSAGFAIGGGMLSPGPVAAQEFIRGDANGDAVLDVADPVWVLDYLFGGGPALCMDAQDANDDGQVDIADAIITLDYLFSGGLPLPLPFPGCGEDPTPDSLGCVTPPAACAPAYPGLTPAGINAQGYEEYTLDIDPTVVLILIPGGTYDMGAVGVAEPVHQVTLSPYFISKYEITNAQYQLYCDQTGAPYPPDPPFAPFTDPAFADHPVVMVSWDDLSAPGGYLDWAGLVLPTEAQWEFAARGTDGRDYPWGNEPPALGAPPYRANYCPNCCGCDADGWQTTSPVGVSPFDQFPGPFGTLDQAGNVWELCQDWYDTYPSMPQTDPTGPASGSYHVIRGAGWYYELAVQIALMSTFRSYSTPLGGFDIGFRPAMIVP